MFAFGFSPLTAFQDTPIGEQWKLKSDFGPELYTLNLSVSLVSMTSFYRLATLYLLM